jgi:DNA-binding MarR family transcriptional regulator
LTTANAPAKGVLDAARLSIKKKGEVMEQVILGFAGCDVADEFSKDQGCRRIPVQRVADIFGVDRGTVTRRLRALEARGLIERYPVRPKHDGGYRCDSLLRLVGP